EGRRPDVDLFVGDDLPGGRDDRRVELGAAASREVEERLRVGELRGPRSGQRAPGPGNGQNPAEARGVGALEAGGGAAAVPTLVEVKDDESRLEDLGEVAVAELLGRELRTDAEAHGGRQNLPLAPRHTQDVSG